MFVTMSIHQPFPGKDALVLEAMHRYAAIAESQPGLQKMHVLRNTATGELIGLGIWEDESAMITVSAVVNEANKDDDFLTLQEPIKAYMFEEA